VSEATIALPFVAAAEFGPKLTHSLGIGFHENDAGVFVKFAVDSTIDAYFAAKVLEGLYLA